MFNRFLERILLQCKKKKCCNGLKNMNFNVKWPTFKLIQESIVVELRALHHSH